MEKSFNYNFHTLDSGLRLVGVPMPGTKAVTVMVFVGTGSKYETKEINGISHFLEHMMFKGTQKRPGTLDISKELESIGASFNAFTSQEYTGYYAKASADKLGVLLDVISDIFLNSKLEPEAIRTEKGVIVEEINMYHDTPSRYVGDVFNRLLYGDQPAGWEIAGHRDTVVNLKREDFLNYFQTHYIASNTIIAVAGRISTDELIAKVEKCFGNVRKGESVKKMPVVESQTEPQVGLYFKDTDQAHFILGVRAYNMFDQRKYAASVLANILGGGMSSRLFSEVREKRGLAYYVGAGSQNMTDTGVFTVRAGVNKERILEAVKVVIDELKKVKSEGVTEEELQRSKDQTKGELALFLEHSDSVAEAYAMPVLFENKVLTPEEEFGKIVNLQVGDISRVAENILQPRTLNLAMVSPLKDKAPFLEILNI